MRETEDPLAEGQPFEEAAHHGEELGLVKRPPVDIREEGGRIVIEPIKADPYELDALLDQMRPETFPEDTDFGPPQGREMW